MAAATSLQQLDEWVEALSSSTLSDALQSVAAAVGAPLPRSVVGRARMLAHQFGAPLLELLLRMGAKVQYLQGMNPEQLRTHTEPLPAVPSDAWEAVQRTRCEMLGSVDQEAERLVRLHAGLGSPLFEALLVDIGVPKEASRKLRKLLQERVQFTAQTLRVLGARHHTDLLEAFERYVSSPRARVYLMRAPGSALLKNAPNNPFAALVEFFQVHDPSVRAEMLLRMHLYIQTGWAQHDLAPGAKHKGAVAAWCTELAAFEAGSHDPMRLRATLCARLKKIFLKATVVNTGSKHRTRSGRTFSLQMPLQPWDLGLDGVAPTGVIDALCPSVDGKVLHVGFASSLPFLDQKDQWQRHTMALYEQLVAKRLGSKVHALRVQVVCSAPIGAPMGKYQAPGVEIARNMSRNGMLAAPVLGMAPFLCTVLEAPHILGAAHLHTFGLQLIGAPNAWTRGIPTVKPRAQIHTNVAFCAQRIAQIFQVLRRQGFAPFDYTIYRNDTTTLGRMIGTLMRLVEALKNLYLAYQQSAVHMDPSVLAQLQAASNEALRFIDTTSTAQELSRDPTARLGFRATLQWLNQQLGS